MTHSDFMVAVNKAVEAVFFRKVSSIPECKEMIIKLIQEESK